MKYILLALALTGCVEVPDEFTVTHEIDSTTMTDVCKDRYGYYDLYVNDRYELFVICGDGSEHRIYKD